MEKISVGINLTNQYELMKPIEYFKRDLLSKALLSIIDTDLYDFDIIDFNDAKQLRLSFYIDSSHRAKKEHRMQYAQIPNYDVRELTLKEIIICKIKNLFRKKIKK